MARYSFGLFLNLFSGGLIEEKVRVGMYIWGAFFPDCNIVKTC